jgi:signal transduction histidine kinase
LSKKFGDLNDEQEEYLNDVHHSSNHLLSLINDILDISKVEAGKVELDPADINLRRILENSLIMIKEKAMRHTIELNLITNGIPDVIHADERKLKQIMYNLLSNAVKFTPDGGQLTVSASSCAPNGESFSADAYENSQWIKIGVKDSGIGLQPEDIDHIFKPFEQVENSTSRRFQGTGLGLSLTKNLVELHGGKIWAESHGDNQGSTFYFILPADRGAAAKREISALRKNIRTDIRNVDKETSSFFKPELN